MKYKQYVKGTGKFSSQNILGTPIVEDVKIRDENSEKKENDDDKKVNPVQYSRKPSVSNS